MSMSNARTGKVTGRCWQVMWRGRKSTIVAIPFAERDHAAMAIITGAEEDDAPLSSRAAAYVYTYRNDAKPFALCDVDTLRSWIADCAQAGHERAYIGDVLFALELLTMALGMLSGACIVLVDGERSIWIEGGTWDVCVMGITHLPDHFRDTPRFESECIGVRV